MMNALLESIFPRYCVVCERLGGYLCQDCQSAISVVSSSCCVICGIPFEADVLPHPCSDCCAQSPHYDLHRSVFVFNDVMKKLIHDFKYRHEFWLKNFFSSYTLPLREFFLDADVVVPVPLHVKQLKHRGYNQSLYLAKFWARSLDKPVDFNSLSRVKETASQTGLHKSERKKNLAQAFSVGDGTVVRGKKILLVDDVHTTGTTLSEAARVLKASGAVSVLATSIAIVM